MRHKQGASLKRNISEGCEETESKEKLKKQDKDRRSKGKLKKNV